MLRQKSAILAFALAAFAAIAVGGTGAFLLARYRAGALAAAADREGVLVGSRAHLLGEELAQLVAEVDRLSHLADIDLADQNLEPEKRVLRIARRDTVLFSTAIVILDAGGQVLWAEPAGARPREDPAALVGLARGHGRASVAYGPGEIDVAAPVAGQGAIVAVVSGEGRRDVFGAGLRASVRGAGGVALVLPGGRGTPIVIARHGSDAAVEAPSSGAGQEWLTDARGARWLVTQAEVAGSPLVLRLVQSAAEVEGDLGAPFRRLALAVAIGSLLALAGGGALAIAVGRLERTELELSRASDLAAMGKTSAAIAHEVKNALNGLSVSLDLLAAGRGEPATLRAVHRQARAEIDRLRDVAEDLTMFASPPRLAVAAVDLAEACRTAAATVAPLAQDCGVRVDVEAPTPVPVRGDPAKLVGAIVNVARNGIEAMGPGAFGERLGEARPARERVLALTARSGEEGAVVEVADRGPGLGAEVRRHLFEPFVTTKRTGTGLGLAITRRVVEAHGGRIEARDREGGGTVFRIALPAAVAEPEAPDREAGGKGG